MVQSVTKGFMQLAIVENFSKKKKIDMVNFLFEKRALFVSVST